LTTTTVVWFFCRARFTLTRWVYDGDGGGGDDDDDGDDEEQ